MVRIINTVLQSVNSYSPFLCVLYSTGLFVEVTSTFTHLMAFSVMCLLHTQVKATVVVVVVVVVVLRVVVQVVSVRLQEQVVHTWDQVAAEEYTLVVEVAEDHKLVLELGVVALVLVVEESKLEQALEVAVAEAAVVLVLVVEGRKLEQVLEVEVVAVVVVLVIVVEDRKLELAVGVVVAQVAVRILFSVDRTVISRQVAHIAT